MGYPSGEDYAVKEMERPSSRLPLSTQEKALAELYDTITQLMDDLRPVLTPACETEPSNSSDKAEPVQSPIADQLDVNNRAIQRATRSLRALMERLEV